MALTFLALVLKVIVPQGFMIAEQGASLPLVICTGHGPMTMTGDNHGGKAPASKKSDAPCAFAGNFTPTAPSDFYVPWRVHEFVVERLIDGRAADLIPGRGLAAPPPQSHAPPTITI